MVDDIRIPPALARAGRIYFSIREAEAEAWHTFRLTPPGPDEGRWLRKAERLGALARRWQRERIRLATHG